MKKRVTQRLTSIILAVLLIGNLFAICSFSVSADTDLTAVSASSFLSDADVMENAVDGNNDTRWHSGQETEGESWIIVSFEESKTLYGLELYIGENERKVSAENTISVYGSEDGTEDSDFELIATKNGGNSGKEIIAFDSDATVKYLKISSKGDNDGYFVIREIEPLYVGSGVKAVDASVVYPSFDKANATDGDLGTDWYGWAEDHSTEHWITIALSEEKKVAGVKLTMGRNVPTENTISVYVSTTGIDALDFSPVKTQYGTNSSVENIWFDDKVDARYIKISSVGEVGFDGPDKPYCIFQLKEIEPIIITAEEAVTVYGVSASSILGSANEVDFLADNNEATMWHSAETVSDNDPWFVAGLDSTRKLDGIVLNMKNTNRAVTSSNTIDVYVSTTGYEDEDFSFVKSVYGTGENLQQVMFDQETEAKYIKVKSHGDGSFFAVSEFSVLESSENIVLTAISGSSGDASKAVDGNLDTMWHSDANYGDWIKLRLNHTALLGGVKLYVHTGRTVSTDHDIMIYGSTTGTEDNDFTLIKSVKGTYNNIETILFDKAVSVKYLKIYSQGDGDGFFALREVEVVEAKFSPIAVAASSALGGGFDYDKATDGIWYEDDNDSNMWHSAVGEGGYIILSLGSMPYYFEKITMYMHTNRPVISDNLIDVYVSTTGMDDDDFELALTQNGSGRSTEVIDMGEPVLARYIKIKTLGDSAGIFSVREIVIEEADTTFKIEGVEDGKMYMNGCSINVRNGKAFLNGAYYTSNTVINTAGEYTLNATNNFEPYDEKNITFGVYVLNIGHVVTDVALLVNPDTTLSEFNKKIYISDNVSSGVYSGTEQIVDENALITEGMTFTVQKDGETLYSKKIAIDNSLSTYMPESELEREQFIAKTYEDEGYETLPELWADKDKAVFEDPLEEEVLSTWEEGGIVYKTFYFTSRTAYGSKIKIYGIYGVQKDAKNAPGILHVHGGGQTAYLPWVTYFAKQGYAAVSIDWGANGEPGKRAIYPAAFSSNGNGSVNGDAETNSWFEWTYACRRALTYLGAQSQCDSSNMGVFGISMGGTLSWMIAAADIRVKAAAPIYGAGYELDYRRYNVYTDGPDNYNNYKPADSAKPYLTAITCEVSAKYITAPLLFINATNDQHGNMDFSQLTYDALPPTTIRRMTYAPSFVHHAFKEQQNDLGLWMNTFLKHDTTTAFPYSPKVTLSASQSGNVQINLSADDSRTIQKVDVYYALETVSAFNRYWEHVNTVDNGNGNYTAQFDVLDLNKICFAYASVLYTDGYHLTSDIVCVKPADIGCTLASAKKSKVIYDFERDGIFGWATQSIGTDPVPEVPLAVTTGVNGVGVAANVDWYELMTFRMNDPRYAAPSNDAKLKVTFDVANNASREVGVYLHESAYNNNYYSSIYRKTIDSENNTMVFSLSDLTPYTAGNASPTSWSQNPVIQIINSRCTDGNYTSTVPEISVMKIEWVTDPVYGDLNNDDTVDAEDLVSMRKALLSIEELDIDVADLNDDRKIDILDFVKLKKMVAKGTDNFR